MKLSPFRAGVLSLLTLIALVAGCASTQQTESMLAAAGFKMIPATTPQQQAHLKTLPAGQVTMAPRDGTNYFVFPDTHQNILYVGLQPQYQEYQKLRLKNQMVEENAAAAQMMSTPDWGAWGAFGPVVVAPGIRR